VHESEYGGKIYARDDDKQPKKMDSYMPRASHDGPHQQTTCSAVVKWVSSESALLDILERFATLLMLSTTCWGVKAASVLWVIKRAEKTEAMVENSMMRA